MPISASCPNLLTQRYPASPTPSARPSSRAAAAPAVGLERIQRRAAIEIYASSEYESLLARGRGRSAIRFGRGRKGRGSFGNLGARGRAPTESPTFQRIHETECRLIIRCPSCAQEGSARRRLRLPRLSGRTPSAAPTSRGG